MLQRLREAEREFIFGEYIDREGDIVSGVVHRIEPRQVVIDLGKAEGVLPGAEQVRNERYRVGQRLKLYLVEVNRTNRGPRLILSRSHPNLVRRLFELEVPEIYNGNVELKAVAREAGYRSKVAVAAKQEGLDPVGSCVGLRGVRIQNVVNELNGERIDVIQWDADPNVFIANALSPAQVVGVNVNEAENTAVVVVPDGQLSLAIGKEGQNARLAARLTGWRIDIKSASAAEAEKVTVEKEKAAVPGAELAKAALTGEAEKLEKRLAVAVPREQYKIPLEQLGLSARTFNLLLGSDIAKVGQLLEKSDKDLLVLRGFGQKSLSEVKERLGALDLGPPPLEEIELPTDEVETIAEEVLEPVEEEVELVPYEPTPEEVAPAEKPQIRFAEDIFGAKPVGVEDKKKGKKKPSREEKLEDGKARRGRRAAALPVADEYEDLSEESESALPTADEYDDLSEESESQ